jgi:acetylornithine deacetylase/succinyl-diaminopimelate desuccinylase-like protein
MSSSTQGSRRIRRPRRTAIGLVGLAGLAVASLIAFEAAAIWPFDGLFVRPSIEERATKLLSDAIQTRTTNPPGNEEALARKLAAELGRAGIKNKVVSTPSPDGGPKRAAVWGRLYGGKDTSDRPALILLSHLDTVPANPEDWSVDPFSGRVWDGFIWGRGALDAKGVTIAHLLTMIELANSNDEFDRDIIFLATPDEETGGQLGAGWIAKNHPKLFEGAGYLLTEGGGIQGSSSLNGERPPLWGVTLTEKAPCWLELRSHGRGGHSSTPKPDAAVPRLIAALDRIRRVESNVRVTDEVGQMFAALAPWSPEWDRAGFSELATALQEDDAFRRRFLDNPGQNALVRNTISITVLEGAPKTNIAPALARAQLDARLLPGESCEDFATAIGALIDEPSIEIEILLSFPSRASSANTPLYEAIARVAANQDPAGIVVPRMIGGFTDAHWFRELGIVSYGFVPRTVAREDARRVHGTDERVSIDTLVHSIELMLEIVRAFDQLESNDSND